MLNFSKKLFGLAGAVTMFTGLSYGQLSCNGTTALSAPANFIRAEGQTELLPTVTIMCTGAGAAATSATLTVYLSPAITITSAFVSGSTTNTLATATIGGNTVNGTVSGSSITFSNVAVGAGTSFVLNNIRVNATAVPTTAGAAPQGISAQAFLSGTAVNPGPTNTATIAYVTNGLKPATYGSTLAAPTDSKVVLANGSSNALSGTTSSFGVCGSLNNSTGAAAAADFYVAISENFQSGFKTKADEGGVAPDVAAQGTRIKVVFANVPGGLNIYMPLTLTSSATPAPAAVLTAITSEAGALVAQTAVTTPAQFTLGGLSVFQVPVSGGTATAVYEVTTDNLSVLDTFVAPVYLNSPTNTSSSQSGAMTIQTSFAPVTAATTIPSFAVIASSSPVLSVLSFTQCTTSLLFPFVTNVAGFETGIAIDNTSKDPFGTRNQSGSCTLSFYGTSATSPTSGPAPNPNEGGTAPYLAGESYAFTLTSALQSASSTNPATFQGYMIASCNFQLAHGFAYIAYGFPGTSSSTMGYLASVLNGRGSTSAETTFQ